jgi:hypothetical protein
MIEMKSFLFILLTNFVFAPAEGKIIKANVYVSILVHCRFSLTRNAGS